MLATPNQLNLNILRGLRNRMPLGRRRVAALVILAQNLFEKVGEFGGLFIRVFDTKRRAFEIPARVAKIGFGEK